MNRLSALMLLAACTGGTDTDTEPTGATDTEDTQATDTEDTEVDAVTLSGAFSIWDQHYAPLAEAEVCWRVEGAEDVCTTSNASGYFTMSVPGESKGHLTLVKDGTIHPFAWALTLADKDVEVGMGIDSESAYDVLYTDVDLEESDGNTIVNVFVTEGFTVDAAVGATVQVSPSVGQGPYYVDESGTLDPALTATTNFGAVYWLDVDPAEGPVSVTVQNADGVDCTEQLHAHTPLEAVDVLPGFALFVAVDCG